MFTGKENGLPAASGKKPAYSVWYKNVQLFCIRMGPNNLPAPSSFPQVEVVARECQHQLNGADGAASVSHLERYKSYIDDTGTMGFIVLQNSVGFDFYFFFLSVFHGSSKGFPCKCFLCIIDLSSF